VVLDEPNANLDDVGEQALAQAVHELKARAATVFLISHRPAVVALADQLVVMGDGEIQVRGPRDAVVQYLQQQQAAQRQAAALQAQQQGQPPQGDDTAEAA